MLKRLRSYFFTVTYPYASLAERETARNLLGFIVLFGAIIVGALIILFGSGLLPIDQPLFSGIFLIPIVFIALTFLVQQGRLQIAVTILLILLSFLSFSGVSVINSVSVFLTFLVPLVAAGVLAGRRTIIVLTIVTGAIFGYVLFRAPSINIVINATNRSAEFGFIVLTASFMAALLIYFGEYRFRLVNLFSLEIDDLRRTLNAPELADFSVNEDGLLKRVIVRLRNEYGFTWVQGALVDSSLLSAERFYMALGLDELQRSERFDLSAATPLAETLRTGEVLQINEESTDSRRRHLSAGMVSALIIPIVHNNIVLGALDMQSSTVADYTQTQQDALRTYGQRVGQSLDRTRLLAQLQADVQQQQNIINGQRQRLLELEQGGRSGLVANTWSSYFEQYSRGALGFDTDNFNLISASDLTPTLQEALKSNTMIETNENDQRILSAPIILRGELLGALSFKLPRGANPNDRQREVIQSVVQRLGLALENKRLLQQSQAQASREAKANEVASVLLSSTDVKTVLQLAAQQFTDALGAVNTHIHLQALDTGEKR